LLLLLLLLLVCFFRMGLFHFVVSLIPQNLLFIAKLLGFESDREKSLVELQSARQKKNPKSTSFHYSSVHFIFEFIFFHYQKWKFFERNFIWFDCVFLKLSRQQL
jgi:hypothetical protein